MNPRKPITFDKLNSIVYRDPQHKLSEITPFMKNIELRVIVVELIERFITKQPKKVSKFLVADATGSAYLNCYDDDQDHVKDGDIIYINGAYAACYKDQMVIHTGKTGLFKIIGEFYMQYHLEPNVSEKDWSAFVQKELNNK